MATHSSVLAWRIPGAGEPGGLPSMGSHRLGHDGSDLAAAACMYMCVLHYFNLRQTYNHFSFFSVLLLLSRFSCARLCMTP